MNSYSFVHNAAIKKLLEIFVVALFLELFLFNFRHWESLCWRELDVLALQQADFDNDQILYINKNGSYGILAPFRDDNWCDIEVFDGKQSVNNIYVEYRFLDADGNPVAQDYSTLRLKVRDEGNELFYSLNDRVVGTDIEKSHYIRINPYGELKGMILTFLNPDSSAINSVEISALYFNRTVPLFFSFGRALGVILLSVIFTLLHSQSVLFKKSFYEFKTTRYAMYTCIALALFMSLIFLTVIFRGGGQPIIRQYMLIWLTP